MTRDEIIKYWVALAEQDHQTMIHLHESKDYHWSLFLGHLVLEKLLKTIYVALVDTKVPWTHDLLRLSEKAGLKPSDKQKDQMDIVTSFNIAARYPDYKHSFYNKCTPAFTEKNLIIIKELKTWLLEVLEKK